MLVSRGLFAIWEGMPMRLLFWTSFILIIYTYAGYPLMLWLYSLVKRLEVQKEKITPSVSIVISVLNGIYVFMKYALLWEMQREQGKKTVE